jgi:hypothetical protein
VCSSSTRRPNRPHRASSVAGSDEILLEFVGRNFLAQIRKRACCWPIRNCAADAPERTCVAMIRPESEPQHRFTQALSTRWQLIGRLGGEVRESLTPSSHRSRRHRCLIQPTTVQLPLIRTDIRASAAGVSARVRRAPVQPRMRSVTVVVALEIEELHLQISGRPEQRAVQVFAPNGADQRSRRRLRPFAALARAELRLDARPCPLLLAAVAIPEPIRHRHTTAAT